MSTRPVTKPKLTRSIDGILSPDTSEVNKRGQHKVLVRMGTQCRRLGRLLRVRPSKRTLVIFIAGVVVIAAAPFVSGLLVHKTPKHTPITNPFTVRVMASVKFSLYYPTYLPTGFHINPESVTEPQGGVVVFDALGPNNQKIFMSEEAQPATFSVAGYDLKFQDLQQYTAHGDQFMATGKLRGVTVGSWSDNNTWILMNSVTGTNVSPSQFMKILKSLRLSY